MKRTTLVFILAMAVAAPLHAAAPGTMRVDYYHTGNDKEESFSLDRVVRRAAAVARQPGEERRHAPISASISSKWPTPRPARCCTRAGFASIYGEWETTGEAQSMNRTFSESLRFPGRRQAGPCHVKKRDPTQRLQGRLDLHPRPADKFIVRGVTGARRRRADQAARGGRSGREARPADSRRRLYGRRARQVRARRQTAAASVLQHVALQGARARHQRLGTGAAGGAVGHLPSVAARSTGAHRSARATTPSTRSATS